MKTIQYKFNDGTMTGNYHTTLATITGNDKNAMLARCERYPLFKQEENKNNGVVDLWKN